MLAGQMRARNLFLSALVLSALACGGSKPSVTDPSLVDKPAIPKGPDKPESEKVTWKKDGSPKNCHSGNKGDGDLVAAVTKMASDCVDKSKMKQVGTPTTGEGSSSTGQMVHTIPLKAQANHCYRVFGLAQSSVKDFDIAVMDSAGKAAGEDGTDGNDAVVLEEGNICFNADDDVSVNVAVADGAGKYAVEIWSD
jgi:hypothetical protein